MAKQTYHLTILAPDGEELVSADVTPARGRALFNAYKSAGKYLIDYKSNPDCESLAWVTMELKESA